VNRRAFLKAVSAFSTVISSPSPNLTGGMLRSIWFSWISYLKKKKQKKSFKKIPSANFL
jgi:hypothetical protein